MSYLINLKTHQIISYLFKNRLVLYYTNKLDILGFVINFEKIEDESLITDSSHQEDDKNMFFISFTHSKTPLVHSGPCYVNKNTIIDIYMKMFDLAMLLYSKNNKDKRKLST